MFRVRDDKHGTARGVYRNPPGRAGTATRPALTAHAALSFCTTTNAPGRPTAGCPGPGGTGEVRRTGVRLARSSQAGRKMFRVRDDKHGTARGVYRNPPVQAGTATRPALTAHAALYFCTTTNAPGRPTASGTRGRAARTARRQMFRVRGNKQGTARGVYRNPPVQAGTATRPALTAPAALSFCTTTNAPGRPTASGTRGPAERAARR
jgi:hypothetical protein